MANFYAEMQGLAGSILREFKQGDISYARIVPGNGPADDPGEPTEVTTSFPGTAKGVDFRYIDGTNIVATDGQVMMPADLGVVPGIEGYITIDGRKHRIVKVASIPPAGTPVVHLIIFKR